MNRALPALVVLAALLGSTCSIPASAQSPVPARPQRAPQVARRLSQTAGDTSATWTELAPAGALPSPRQYHTSIYDPVRDRMVTFGGRDDAGWYRNEIWTLSLDGPPAWSVLTPAGTPPGARMLHTAIYDPVRDRMVVFGGWDGTLHQFGNDIWAVTFAGAPEWTRLAPSGLHPAGRDGHTAVYDPVRDRMVVFGGWNVSPDVYFDDVWALSLADPPAWSRLMPSGTPPRGRILHSAIYDPIRDRMVVFGGDDRALTVLDDVWSLSLGDTLSWKNVSPVDALQDLGSAVYDPARDRMLVLGPYGPAGFKDLSALPLSGTPNWDGVLAAGSPPPSRGGWSAVYQPKRDRLVMFGGYGSKYRNDVWALGLGAVSDGDGSPTIPMHGALSPPAPNPTRESVRLSYSLARAGKVQLGVFDVGGRMVRNLLDGELGAGHGTVDWNGNGEDGARLESGVYFVRLAGPGIRQTRKLVLLR